MCGSRHVGRVAEPVALPLLVDGARAREQERAALVERQREHVRIVIEDPLHAVAVVRVDIDVHHACGVVLLQPPDRDGEVIVDAEAGGLGAARVVQSAGDAERARVLPAHDQLGRAQGRATHVRSGFVHAAHDGNVRRAESERLQCCERPRPTRDAAYGLDELRRVRGEQLLVGRDACRYDLSSVVVQQVQCADQLQRELEPARVQRVLGSEPILRERVIPYERGAVQCARSQLRECTCVR